MTRRAPDVQDARRGAAVLAAVLAASLAAACTATPYQPLGRRGGYETTRLDSTSWRVRVEVNSHTPPDSARAYAQRRAAELCRERGFVAHYVIDEVQASPREVRMTGLLQGEVVTRTRVVTRIRCTNDPRER